MFYSKRPRETKQIHTRRSRRRHELRVALFRQSFKPRFEVLEERALLATVTWIGASGNWNDGFNWSTGSSPGPLDDAIIPDLLGTQIITIQPSGADVQSITSQEEVRMFGAGGIRVTQASAFNAGFNITGGSGSLRGGGVITISGTSIWAGSSPSIGLSGSVSIRGVLAIDTSGGSFNVDGSLTAEGGSNIQFAGSNPLVLNGSLSTNLGGTFFLAGFGSVTNPSGTGTINNDGTLLRSSVSTSVTVAAALNNTGTVRISSGFVTFTGGVTQYNTATDTLSGGTWLANGTGNLRFNGLGDPISILTGTANVTVGDAGSWTGLSSLGNVDVGTSFTISGGNDFTSIPFSGPASNLVVEGSLTVSGTGSKLTGASSGVTAASGGTVTLAGGGQLSLGGGMSVQAGGTLQGDGNVQAAFGVNNAGTLAPGASPGILNITGNLTLDASSVTNIEVQGTNPGTPDFDQILVSGIATLGGTLNVSLLNGFYPDKSESIQIIQAASRIGDFGVKNLPQRNGSNLVSTTLGATFYDLAGTAYAIRNTNDNGAFSLRQQITNANANAGTDQILFNIGSGQQSIVPNSPLPTITENLVLDGTSQVGYAGVPLIEFNGTNAGVAANGLKLGIGSGGSIIKGLAINRFSGSGIWVDSSNNTISDNFIGTDTAGNADLGNTDDGIAVLTGSDGNLIKNNLVSGNNATGILLQGNSNKVQGNKVGTNQAGNADLGNGLTGVWMYGGSSNFVGVDGDGIGDASEGNLVSGNDNYGVYFQGNSDNNVIAGNLIGTNASGTAAIGNTAGGIIFFNDFQGDNNRIGTDANGTSDTLERNVISGNANYGVVDFGVGTTIAGNYVGIAADGSTGLPNAQGGVSLASSGAIVGGAAAASRNVISGNAGFGVAISLATGTGNTVLGNYIGVDANGTAAVANTSNGVQMDSGATNNTIGGTTAAARNIISGNTSRGVYIVNVTTGTNTVQGNYIGVDVAGTADLGNGGDGITVNQSSDQIIGGAVAGAGNLISGNNLAGIEITNATSTGNIVAGNFIGTNASGTAKIANSNQGLVLSAGANANTIGGATAEARNLISGNNDYGITIDGTSTTGNFVLGNYIGTNAAGTAAVANANDGIVISNGASTNTIGGTAAGSLNVISGNTGNGVSITGISTSGNQVFGNYIGVGANGSTDLGNSNGVVISDARNNFIGSGVAGAGNVISGNAGDVVVLGTGASGNRVQGNRISMTADGLSLIAPSFGYGVYVANGAFDTVIGTFTDSVNDATEGNLIGFASTAGIFLQDNGLAPNRTVIAGNQIGLNASGATLSIGVRGIWVQGATNTRIGTDADGTSDTDERNVIVPNSNGAPGILLTGGSLGATTGTRIAGNYIGLDPTGENGRSNATNFGIVLQADVGNGISSTIIGGTSPSAKNVVGSLNTGIELTGALVTNNSIQGNYIGTDKDGVTAIPNGNGVAIVSGANNNLVGGVLGGATNVISGNNFGVAINGGNANTVAGNYVGLASDGLTALGNSEGIRLSGNSNNNTIGGVSLTMGLANYASGNPSYGIVFIISPGTSGNTVVGNIVGLNIAEQPRSNGNAGLIVNGAGDITIGGIVPGSKNVFSGNDDNADGIWLNAATNITIQGNYIGTDTTGEVDLGNSAGIAITAGSSNITIGGTTAEARNIISGNDIYGIGIDGSSNNFVRGNYIGTDKDGVTAIANVLGIRIDNGASNNTIGGTTAGARNVISGNTADGINIGVSTPGTVIQGNFIGTAADGTTALGNVQDGIITGSPVQIGGLTAIPGIGAGNVISGNGNNALNNYGNIYNVGATGVVIQGNILGLDKNGANVVRQTTQYGIWNFLANGTTIGGATTTARNIISGNGAYGLLLQGGSGLLVQNNYIGTDISGDLDKGNTLYGISTDTKNSTFRGNVISGNDSFGVYISGQPPQASNIEVVGNIIGLNASGTAKLGNTTQGLVLDSTVNVTVGGTTATDRNVISGNSGTGIAVGGTASTGIVIQGNYIGLGADGVTALGNPIGLDIAGDVSGTIIGGTVAGAGNVISGNDGQGVLLDGTTTVGTLVQGNFIGTDKTGSLAKPNAVGVQISGGAINNTIGGTTAGAGNVISGNTAFGIQILGVATSGNLVRGNLLGTDYDGQASIGNGIGIRISDNSTNIIGGLTAGQANVIAYSGGAGIELPDTAAASSAIRGNRVYNNLGLAIDVGASGATLNDNGDSDGYRNAPVFTSAVLSGGNLLLSGFSRPNAQIDLFTSNPTLSGYGQGKQFLTTLVEGTNDTDATTGTYGPGPVLGRMVGTDTTNRFQFSIPLNTLPTTLQTGSLLAAVSIGSTSEFSAIAVVGDPASSLKPIVDIGPDIPLASDLLFDRIGTFVDPDSTQWTVLVNYGDGSPEESIAYSSEPIVSGNGFGKFGDGTNGYDTVYRFQLRHQYERASAYVVTARVIDNASAVGTDTAVLTGPNHAPEIGENLLSLTPSRINEGGSVTLVGRFTDSSIRDTHTVSVDWGDGAITPGTIDPSRRTFSATHVYLDDGLSNAPEHAYPIQATLIDNLGAIDKTTFGLIYARVVNVQPNNIQLTLTNANLTENDVVSLGGTFAEPGILDTHLVTIDWGDSSPLESFMLAAGITSFSGKTHRYLNDVATGPDRYPITVKIADDDQLYESVIASTMVNVLNAAPQIVALNSSAPTISEGQSVSIGGTFSDVGTLDGHTVTIDWGDGSAITEFELSAGITSFSGISHRFVDDSHTLAGGVFPITVTVSDHDGGSASSALQVTVLNVAPSVSGLVLKSGGVVVTGPITEGTLVALTGSYSDPGLIDQQLVRIYWGDGTDSLASVNSQTSTIRATHRYVDDRPSSLPSLDDKIVVVVDDQDLGVSTTSFAQVITNVAPTAAILPDLGSTLTTLFFKSTAGDAGSADVPTLTYRWTVALAPGSTGNAPIVVGSMTNPKLQIDRNSNLTASYVVTLVVSDDELATTTVSSTIIVLDNTSNTFIPTLAQQPSGTDTVTILGLDGNDYIDVSAWTIATVLDGGMGDDMLIDGSGNSTIILHQGNDSGRGRGGDDTYSTTFNSTQTIDDSFGANILDFSPTSFGVTFDLQLAISSLTDLQDVQPSNPGVHFANINGSFAQLIGTSGADNFTLASGVTSRTGAGNDMIKVGVGTTRVTVDAGADNDVFLTFGIGAIGSIDFQGDIGADTFTNAFGVTIGSVDMGGGADNDVFQNYGAITGMIDFQGDFGADTFTNFAGGLLTSVNMGGGADNDVFQNYGVMTGTIDFQGDFGADTFTNELGATLVNINMGGGADNDVFQNYGSITGTIDFQGDFGIDTFTNELNAMLVKVNMGGGADNDVFQNFGTITGLIDFQGDFGADTFTNEVGATILNIDMGGGADNDVFQNYGIITGLIDFQGDIGADTFTNEVGATILNVDMGGGADNDVFQNLGTITGQIDFQGDIGADTFINEVGATILNVDMGGGADNDVFQNFGTITGQIDFQGDFGADTFINELGATISSVNMGGGADNDVFQNYGAITGTIDFQGDSDRDLFINREGAITGTATAPSIVRIRGNADNDIFVNFGLMNSFIDMSGGADNDVFQNLGIITGTIDFQGDIGADTFVNGPGAFVTGGIDMGGGADNDVFQNFGTITGQIDFSGDIGADTLTNFLGGQMASVTMNGGADNDVLLNFGLAGNITMNGGADNDVFANAGTLTGTIDFQGDSGIDTLVNDIRGIAGVIDMGGGADADYLLNYGRARSISFLGGIGDDTLLVDGVVEGAIFFNGDLGADVLIDSGTGFLVNGIPTTTIRFLGGSDLDALQNNASNILLIDFQGDDGADVFQNNGESVRQIIFNSGIGDDTFENNAKKVTNIRFDAGDGNDRFFNDGNEVTGIEFIGGNDLDALLNTGSFVSQITMNGGADSDYFINSGSQVSGVTIDGGVGDDQIQNYGKSLSQVTFIGGDGNDLFRNRSSAEGSSLLKFNGDIGADTFVNEASSISQITMNGGADNDVFLNFGLSTTNVDFSGDGGNDTFQNSADDFAKTSSLTVPGARFVGGDGNDQFFQRGDRFGWLDYNGGNGLDQFNVGGNNGARVTFAGGNDLDTLVNFGDNLSFIDFSGDDGSDSFVNLGNFLGEAHFRGGLGDDKVDSRGSDLGWLEFVGGYDNDFLTNSGARIARLRLIGGNGADAMLNRGSDVSSIEFDGGDGADSLNSIGSGYSSVQFLGGLGDDTLVVSGVGTATAIINGNTGPGNDVVALKGSYQMATINGDSGNDRFHLFGNGGLTINGGAGNDQYYFIGNPNAQVSIKEAADADQDLLSFASFTGGGITLDLEVNSLQPLSPTSQLSLTLQGNTTGIEDVIGTVGLDTIYGNARPNRLLGAETSTLTAAIAPVSSMQQWVLLDFDSSTDTGEHFYSQAERDQIQARIATNYQGPGGASNPWFHVYFTQNRLQILTVVGANYATIHFNRTPETGTGGGHASDLDFRNVSLQGEAQVQVNGIVGAAGYPEATSDNFIALSAKIGAHELGHLMGLRHEDAIGPIGYGLHSPPGNADYKPAFTGPSAGYDAFDHLIGSPATVGSDRFNDLRSLFFGEREAVKLAFNESGTSIPEGSTHSTLSSAQPINMLSMSVPNTLISGFNAGKQFDVAALNVMGSINLDSTGKSQSDWYSFEGKKGDLVNLAIYSAGLSRLTTHTQTIDSILRVYDASGALVPYYDGVAVNDDQFEPTDSSLTDLVLPADGIYYIEVDTFARATNDPLANPDNPLSPLNPNYVPPGLEPQEINDAVRDRIAQFQDALLDRDTGSYELFVYRFATRTTNAVGDVLVGRGGVDILDGGPGSDYSLRFGTLPTAATSFEGSTYTATIPFSNPGAATWTAIVNYGDGAILNYSGFSPQSGLSLSHIYADNGSYPISIQIQNDDGKLVDGNFTNTVVNLPPVPTIASISNPRQEGTSITVTGSATDPAGVNDTIALSWSVIKGVGSTIVVASGTGASVSFTPADNDTYRVRLTAADEDGGSASVFLDFVVANVDPTVSLSLNVASSITAGTSVVATSTATDPAGANDPLTYSWTILRNGAAFATQAGGTSHTFTPTLAGTYDISLLVNDGDGGLVSVTRTVVVTAVTSNTLPTVAITTPVDGVFNVASTFGFGATDLDAVDQNGLFTYSIQWGDGTSSTVVGPRNITVPKTYTRVSSSGAFTISAQATDARGATGPVATSSFVVLGWTLMTDPVASTKAILVIVGSQGPDNLKVKTKDDDYYRVSIRDRDDDVRRRGTIYGDVDRILVFAQSGNDKVTIDDDIDVSAEIWGGAGDDDLKGGSGNDIIMGEAGNDNLWGGDGRDIVIGGIGADRIHGDAKDDILIAGFTAFEAEFNRSAPAAFAAATRLTFEQQRVALEAILAEWTNRDRSFATRRLNILGTGTGTRANGNNFLRVSDTVMTNNTVFDDDAVDKLWGDDGTDWFFANTDGVLGNVLDIIKDRTNNELAEDIDKWW